MTEPDHQPASYEAANERLEQIIARLDSGQAGLRETLELCAEGKGLVEYCAGELDAVSHGLQELRLDELVDRLDPGAIAPGAEGSAAAAAAAPQAGVPEVRSAPAPTDPPAGA